MEVKMLTRSPQLALTGDVNPSMGIDTSCWGVCRSSASPSSAGGAYAPAAGGVVAVAVGTAVGAGLGVAVGTGRGVAVGAGLGLGVVVGAGAVPGVGVAKTPSSGGVGRVTGVGAPSCTTGWSTRHASVPGRAFSAAMVRFAQGMGGVWTTAPRASTGDCGWLTDGALSAQPPRNSAATTQKLAIRMSDDDGQSAPRAESLRETSERFTSDPFLSVHPSAQFTTVKSESPTSMVIPV